MLGDSLEHDRIDHTEPSGGDEQCVECVVVANDLEISNAAELVGSELDAHQEIVGEAGTSVADRFDPAVLAAVGNEMHRQYRTRDGRPIEISAIRTGVEGADDALYPGAASRRES